MRDRLVDSALVAGLVIVCVVIVFTLFSPSSGPFRRATTPANPAETINEANGDAVPEVAELDIPSDTVSDSDAGIIPIIPSEGASSELDNEAASEGANEAAAQDTAEDVTGDVAGDATENATESLIEREPEPTDNLPLTSGDAPTNPLVSETQTDAQEAEAPAEQEASLTQQSPPQPIPEGAFDLERVGFSYVTGGAGACSVVLEAWQHVAVSTDILEKYPCGTRLSVVLGESVAGRDRVSVVVADTMPPTKARTVNIYVGADEPALEYGVIDGRLEP